MKYTKKQRHEIYKKALDRFDEVAHVGLCEKIAVVSGHNLAAGFCFESNINTLIYPELFLFKTRPNPYWLSCYQDYDEKTMRKIVLMFCIEMTR